MLPYLRRWAVQGRKPSGDSATTIFDLLHDRRHVNVYPATVDTYAVTVEAPAVRMLTACAISGDACTVPAEHARHGRRLLGLHPHQRAGAPPWPMELSVVLPSDEIRIVYRHDGLRLLISALSEIAQNFEPADLVDPCT